MWFLQAMLKKRLFCKYICYTALKLCYITDSTGLFKVEEERVSETFGSDVRPFTPSNPIAKKDVAAG